MVAANKAVPAQLHLVLGWIFIGGCVGVVEEPHAHVANLDRVDVADEYLVIPSKLSVNIANKESHMPEVRTSVARFEQICRESNLAPVKKIQVGFRIVLIADGYCNDHPNFRGPHYTTLWAVGKDEETLEVARPLYFEGLGTTSREQRIAAAEEDGIACAEELNARHRHH